MSYALCSWPEISPDVIMAAVPTPQQLLDWGDQPPVGAIFSLTAGRGLMMVGEGGATGEGGGAGPSGSGFLQSVGVVERAAHSGVAAATCGGGRAGGTRGGLRRIGLQRFDPAEPAVWGVGAGLRRHQGRQARTHGVALGARMRGCAHLRDVAGASPATPPLSRFSAVATARWRRARVAAPPPVLY